MTWPRARADTLRPGVPTPLDAPAVPRVPFASRHLGILAPRQRTAPAAALRDGPANRPWSEPMAGIMVVGVDRRTGFPFLLLKQRSLD